MADNLEAQVAELEAKVAALETLVNTLAANTGSGEAVSKAKPEPVVLLGTPFKVGNKSYKLRYPVFNHGGRSYTEADLLGNAELQKELVEGGYKVVEPA